MTASTSVGHSTFTSVDLELYKTGEPVRVALSPALYRSRSTDVTELCLIEVGAVIYAKLYYYEVRCVAVPLSQSPSHSVLCQHASTPRGKVGSIDSARPRTASCVCSLSIMCSFL